ncbi:MAG: hypothetical protein J6I64_00090, partial [Lachnospiraceae bacterium]|nr:hypothetical protein [Lachnospiraceae bacterium]
MKKRMLALFLAFSMMVGMLPGNMALANQGEQTLMAVQAEGISVDNVLSELVWTETAAIDASAEGAPSGSVAAAWDKDNLYLGITAANADSVKAELGSKTIEALLINGAAELVVPWNDAGITLWDYNDVIEGLKITLNNSSASTELSADVKITSLVASDIILSGMSQYGTKTNMDVTEDQLVWTSETNTTDQVLKQNDARVDHTKNILLTQTLKIDALPVGTGEYAGNTAPTENTYYFWISDTVAKGTGAAVWCNVYCADAEGNLALRVNLDAGNNKSKSGESVALGRKLGDTFQLALLWNADESVVIYVDGKMICEVENATIRATEGWGNKAFRFAYKGSENKASITLSDAVLSTSGLASVTESMTKSAVLGSVDLTAVTENLDLPAVYTDPIFGDVALSWISSDESILAEDGTVTRLLGTVSKTVQLSLVAFGKTVWTLDVTVLPAVSGLAVSASCADEITVDGNVNEKYYTHFETISASSTEAPSGRVSAVYNKNGLYVGLKYENAQTMEVSLNGKSTTVALSDGTCTGVGTAAVQNDSAEVFLPWADLGVTLSDYYQENPGFQVTLTGAEQASSSLKSSTSTLVITSEQVNEVAPNRMSTTGNKADLSADATKAIWNTEAQGVSVFYQTGYEFVDHSKDMLFSQTLQFVKLPVSTGTYSGDLQANDSYYFWISDYA